jgi:methylthioribose-1-phosphate isomerase
MTHCNAGWLATVQWGTALAPIYRAAQEGIPVHVWVSETRPRNQGASLSAWELRQAGVDHTLVADNACGHLLASGEVDCVLVGSDRTAANGDVCNKVGTYLKALASAAHAVPFYVALPMSTVDWQCATGRAIPIEHRPQTEVVQAWGRDELGDVKWFELAPEGCKASNPAFDVTPAALVTGLVTEFGVFTADSGGMAALKAAGAA